MLTVNNESFTSEETGPELVMYSSYMHIYVCVFFHRN